MDAQTKAVVTKLTEKITSYDAMIVKFSKEFIEHPGYALDWADSIFEAVARRQVLLEVTRSLSATGTKATIATIREHALKTALAGAKHPKQSSSVSATMLHRWTVAAWAELADPLWGDLTEV